MSGETKWLPKAALDVQRLRKFIALKNPLAAKRAALRIKNGVNLLLENPQAGRLADTLPQYRELILSFGAGH